MKKLGGKLVLAGKVHEEEERNYFDEYIKPYLGDDIKYVGELGHWGEEKMKYFSNAKAYLYPIKWEEPFGITMAEAMACGTPVVMFAGAPSASATSGFVISVAPARPNKVGILLYTSAGRANLPFPSGGHILCVQFPPLKRGGPVNSGGTSGPNCDGVFSLDMNQFASGNYNPGFPTHNPAAFLLVPGQQVNCQWWGRDSPATGSFMSDGLEYTVCP